MSYEYVLHTPKYGHFEPKIDSILEYDENVLLQLKWALTWTYRRFHHA